MLALHRAYEGFHDGVGLRCERIYHVYMENNDSLPWEVTQNQHLLSELLLAEHSICILMQTII